MYLCAVKTPAVGRHSTVWQVYCRQPHPIRLFEAGLSQGAQDRAFSLCGRRSVAPRLELWVERVVGFEKERREGALSCPASPALEQSAPGWLPCGVRGRSSCLRERCYSPWACGLGEVLLRGCLAPCQRA